MNRAIGVVAADGCPGEVDIGRCHAFGFDGGLDAGARQIQSGQGCAFRRDAFLEKAVGEAEGDGAAATGMNADIRIIGGGIGVALVTAVVTGTGNPHGYPPAHGAVFSLAALLIAVRIPKDGR